MSGRRVAAITRRLLRQFRRDRRTLALVFVAPLVVLALLQPLVRGSDQSPRVDVVDSDGGPLAVAVSGLLLSNTRLHASSRSLADAEARLAAGTTAAYVVLPPGFSTAAAGGSLAPEVHLEGTDPAAAAQVSGALAGAVVAAAALQASAQGVRAPALHPTVTYLHGGSGLDELDYLGPALVGLVVFFLVFVITCVAFLRERSQGTLERLMASPLRRPEIVTGYMLGFGVLALAQAAEVILFMVFVIRVHEAGNLALVFGFEALLAVVAVNLGIFLSMFARTEFQAVQFIPIVLVPQIFLGGVFFPVAGEPGWMQWLSNVLPLTYAVDGLRAVMLRGDGLSPAILRDGAVLLAYAVACAAAAATTLRRRVA